MRGEVGLENFPSAFGRDAGAVVADFKNRLRSTLPARDHLNLTRAVHGLNGIEQEVEQHLTEKLFVRAG